MLNLSKNYKFLLILAVVFFTSAHCKPYQNLYKKHYEAPRSSIKGIDGTYVMNLDIRPEKWHRIESMLYYHGIDYVRFSGVWPYAFSVPTIKEYCAKHLRIGALGCMMSHLSIYNDALERGLKVIWVLEDDIVVKRDPKLLTGYIKELDRIDPNWDILYTDLDFVNKDGVAVINGAFPIDKKPPFPPRPIAYYTYRHDVSKNIRLIRSRYGTCSMIVSERGMKKMLKHFTTYHDIKWPIDIEMHYVPGLRQYGLIDPVLTNAHFVFNISDTGSPNLKRSYEIDDANMEYMEERVGLYKDILSNWYEFIGEPKTIKR